MSYELHLGDLVYNHSRSLRGTVTGISIMLGFKRYRVTWDNDTVGWYSRKDLF